MRGASDQHLETLGSVSGSVDQLLVESSPFHHDHVIVALVDI